MLFVRSNTYGFLRLTFCPKHHRAVPHVQLNEAVSRTTLPLHKGSRGFQGEIQGCPMHWHHDQQVNKEVERLSIVADRFSLIIVFQRKSRQSRNNLLCAHIIIWLKNRTLCHLFVNVGQSMRKGKLGLPVSVAQLFPSFRSFPSPSLH